MESFKVFKVTLCQGIYRNLPKILGFFVLWNCVPSLFNLISLWEKTEMPTGVEAELYTWSMCLLEVQSEYMQNGYEFWNKFRFTVTKVYTLMIWGWHSFVEEWFLIWIL